MIGLVRVADRWVWFGVRTEGHQGHPFDRFVPVATPSDRGRPFRAPGDSVRFGIAPVWLPGPFGTHLPVPQCTKAGGRLAPPVALPLLVLASASPRRRRLLDELGLPLEVRPADLDESGVEGSVPEQVGRLACLKAARVASTLTDGYVLGADTLGCFEGDALGKPTDVNDAMRILWRLSGRAHDVLSGVTVLRVADGDVVARAEEVVLTKVTFRSLGLRDIQAYLETGEYEGKAGSYAIQGAGRRLVESIDGPYTNVVGLPVGATLRLLAEIDYPVPDVDVAALDGLPDAGG